MNILVVDDDIGARALMRRVLVRDFNAHVVEADDGVTALERLLAEPIDLLFLDIRMRVMDGLRTLEAVRRSPRYAGLRVVMMTGIADQERVQRAMALGVTDFILKPLTPAALRERLSKIIPPGAPASGDAPAARLDLKPSDRVILLDRDAAFRDFFRATMPPCHVDGADTELAALRHCQTGPVAALFVGTAPGLIDLHVFLQTFRGAIHPREVPVFALVPSRELESVREAGVYDGALVRSYDARSFMRGLTHVLSDASLVRLLFGPTSPGVAGLFSLASSTFRIVGQSVTVRDVDTVRSAPARWLVGSVSLCCGRLTWELLVHLPFGVALEMLGALREVATDELSESQVSVVPGDLATQWGAHLREEGTTLGLAITVSPARLGTLPSSSALPMADAGSGLVRALVTAEDKPVAVIQLVHRPAAGTIGFPRRE